MPKTKWTVSDLHQVPPRQWEATALELLQGGLTTHELCQLIRAGWVVSKETVTLAYEHPQATDATRLNLAAVTVFAPSAGREFIEQHYTASELALLKALDLLWGWNHDLEFGTWARKVLDFDPERREILLALLQDAGSFSDENDPTLDHLTELTQTLLLAARQV